MKIKALITICFLLFFMHLAAQYKHDSIKVEHGYLHYYTKGQGKPLVLLQGNTGASSYYMRSLGDSIAGHRIILVDYQGTGRSVYRPEDVSWATIDNIVNDYELVRKHLKIEQWTLIGHSYGGQHALYYAAKYPQSTSRVITIGGVTTNNNVLKYWFDNLSFNQSDEDKVRISQLMQDTVMNMVTRDRELMELWARPAFFNKKKARLMSDYFTDEELMISQNVAYQRAWMSHPEFASLDFSNEVYALNIPVRLIQGRQDPVGQEIPVVFQREAKNAELVFIDQCGHFP